ncbi:MAG TPA: AAA family ATPase [Solirubrobacteraceae bacterium]|nr:AAA family ATPase [Solirubrobacteraceae bacterium]
MLALAPEADVAAGHPDLARKLHLMEPSGAGRTALVGRDRELAMIEAALRGAPEHGSALVFRGEAGVGKTVLLEAARRGARGAGMRVLPTSGVEAESELPYSGLHRLLRPLLAAVDQLPVPQRSMLLGAFGVEEHGNGDLFLVALAALGLLSGEAARQPLLVTIDDIHWLDGASLEVLAFVARRVESDPIMVLGAVRAGHESRTGPLGLPEHLVDALDARAASALLDAHAPGLAPALKRRLLDEAAGNPLALVELPGSIATMSELEASPILPLSARLEQAFADRARDAQPDTSALLLVLAADVTSPLAEVLAAGEIVLGRPVTVAALQPAFDVGLVRLEGPALHFRHPLVRSAIYQSATIERRQVVHAALAQVVVGQPDRRAHHRAAAAAGPDEDVAGELEEMGERALRRGAALQASAALARAATLSIDPQARVRRLLGAAEPAFEAGRADLVQELVERARREPLSERDTARAEWLSEIFHDGSGPTQGDADRVLQLVDLGLLAAGREPDLTLSLLMAAALRCWWGGSEPEVRRRVVEAVNSLEGSPTDARRVATIAMAEPIGNAVEVAQLIAEAGARRLTDARGAYLLGMSGHAIGDYDQSLRLFATAAQRLRDEGRLALLAQTLVLRSVELFLTGDWTPASSSASEAARLAEETHQPIWLAGALGARAGLAGVHGDLDAARALLAEASSTLESTGSHAVAGWLQVVRGVIELSAGQYDEAYADLVRTFDAADSAYHVQDQFMGLGFLADAAVGCGAIAPARGILASLERLARPSSTIGVRMGLRYARSLLARDDEAEDAFRVALAAPGSSRPFERARLQLAFGMWLRRQRRVVESRDPLRLARSGFDALDAPTWGERARQELRAAGETSTKRERQAWDDLSPQELQIAQLAAAGLSNREIGQQLYLSHRTVASHLYRAYPKLGITSRSQLNAVLPAQAHTGTLGAGP